jgi:hypothetical protein
MKYLEQRIDELEKEVALLKAKNKLEETKGHDYMYNHSNICLLSEPDLETTFASPWDSSEIIKNPLDTITEKLSSIKNYDFQGCYPPYPNIISSWD